jgi:hypothetical protein
VAFGPRSYRKFVRQTDRFIAVFPWLWFGGCAAVVALFVLPLAPDERRVGLAVVCALTIYPCIVGWLGLSGVALVWGVVLGLVSFRAKRRRQAALAGPVPRIGLPALAYSVSLLVAGVVFVCCAIGLLVGLLGDVFTWSRLAISG